MADKPVTRLASEMARLPAAPFIPGVTWNNPAPTTAFGAAGSKPFVGAPNATQARRDNNDAYMAGLNNRVPLQNMNDLSSPVWLTKYLAKTAKENFFDPIWNMPKAFDPTSGLSPMERVTTGLGGGLALADAFTPFMPEGALANALAKRATNRAIAETAAARVEARLLPGQGYGFHVSHMPNLTTIEDIQGLRNIGGNFGTMYDSTQFTPEGATYAFGIPEGNVGAQREVQGAIDFANTAKRTAAQNPINPENRNYTMYFTKGNPLEREGAAITTGRLADPEYAKSALLNKNQTVFGKQEVLSKLDLDLDAYNAPREALRNSPLAQSTNQADALLYNEEMLKVLNHEASFVDNIYKALSADPAFSNFLSFQAQANKRAALQRAVERQRIAAKALSAPPRNANQRRA